VALTKDLVLVVWGAMNLLAEAEICSDRVERSEMLSETERVLFDVLIELAALPERDGINSTPVDVIVH